MLAFALVAGSVWVVLGECLQEHNESDIMRYLVCISCSVHTRLRSAFLLKLLMLVFLRYAARDAGELERRVAALEWVSVSVHDVEQRL